MKTTRLELFEQVWVTPMTKLAKNFGCSDVGLRKACIKFEIPLPPQGHWQKLLYGKGFAKPEIPRPKYNPEIEINPVAVKVEGRLVPIVDLADTIFLYMFLPMQVRRRHLSRLLSRHHRLINVFPYGASEASSLIL